MTGKLLSFIKCMESVVFFTFVQILAKNHISFFSRFFKTNYTFLLHKNARKIKMIRKI